MEQVDQIHETLLDVDESTEKMVYLIQDTRNDSDQSSLVISTLGQLVSRFHLSNQKTP